MDSETAMNARLLGVLLLVAIPLAAQQPSPRELFERARILEESNRSLDEAVAIYGQLASQSGDRELAAAAQLRVGIVLERLGRIADARRALQIVVSEYADIARPATEARQRLNALADSGSARFVIRRVTDESVDILSRPFDDGRFLTWTDWDGNLRIRDASKGLVRTLVRATAPAKSREYAFYAVPSRDGARIAYSWFNERQQYDLRVIDVATPRPRVLAGDATTIYAQPIGWAADGRRILAVLTGVDHVNQIAWVDLQGRVSVLKTLDWRYPQAALSPDGRFVAYAFPVGDATHRDIHLLATDGSREIVVAAHPAEDAEPVWAPDDSVLFVSSRAGTPGLWRVAIADGRAAGEPQLVRGDFGSATPLGVTRTGVLYYGVMTGRHDVYTAEIAGRAIVRSTLADLDRPGRTSQPDWSPDGRSLLYISDRGPVWAPGRAGRFTIRNVDIGSERIVNLSMRAFLWPAWSPDGRAVAVVGMGERSPRGIYLVDPASGAASPVVLQEPESAVTAMDWFPDARSLAYILEDRSGRRILRRQLDDGTTSVIAPAGDATWLAVSPDGNTIGLVDVSTRNGPAECRLLDVASGQSRSVFQAPPDTRLQRVIWTPDGSALVVRGSTAPGRSRTRLWWIDIRTGAIDPMTLDGGSGSVTDFQIHPDGRRVAYTIRTDGAELWTMENFLPPASPLRANIRNGRR